MRKVILAALTSLPLLCAATAWAFLAPFGWSTGKTHDPARVFPCRKAWLHVSGHACLPLTSPPTFPAGNKTCLNLEIEDAHAGNGVLETWWIGPWGEVRSTTTRIETNEGQSLRAYS